MFRSSHGEFIPPMLPGVVVFMRGFNRREILRQIAPADLSTGFGSRKSSRFCGSICFNVPGSATMQPGRCHWIRAGAIPQNTRLFGWKFWSFIVGAARCK